MGSGSTKPPEKSQNIGIICNTGPDPLKYHKAVKLAFNDWPSSSRQRNVISWRADEGPLIVVLDPTSPRQPPQKKEKMLSTLGPL